MLFEKPSSDRIALKKVLKLIIIGQFLMSPAEACNVIVKAQADVELPSFNLRDGEICITDETGRLTTVSFSNFVRKTTYKLSHYTSDYGVTLYTTSGECQKDDEEGGKSNGTIMNYQCQYPCQSEPSQNCVHFISLRREGDLYSVWERIKEFRELTFHVEGPSYSQEVTLGENSTKKLDLRKFGAQNLGMSLTPGELEDMHTACALLQYDDKFYAVNCTYLGHLWDYQISVDRRVTTYIEPNVTCAPLNNCSCSCSLPHESPVGALIRRFTVLERPMSVVPQTDSLVVDVFESGITDSVWVRMEVKEQEKFDCAFKWIGIGLIIVFFVTAILIAVLFVIVIVFKKYKARVLARKNELHARFA